MTNIRTKAWGAIAVLVGTVSIAQQAQRTPEPAKRPPTAQELEAWRHRMLRVPKPKKGCFKAAYPDTKWTEVQCTAAPKRPYPPRSGPPASTVGDGMDFYNEVTGDAASAEGSFDSVTGVLTESGAGIANAYSLQLNTESFSGTATCSGAANPASCQGWEQFVFSNSPPGNGLVFIQYWLLDYAGSTTTCPDGWASYQQDCYISSSATSVPPQTIANLGQVELSGAAASDTVAFDSVGLTIDSEVYAAMGDNHFPDLSRFWHVAEFNIFGDGNGTQAVFNSGSTIVVRAGMDNGTMMAPSCVAGGFTGETNNLTLVSTPTFQVGTPLPSIIFTESNAAGPTPATCATARGEINPPRPPAAISVTRR